jgi:hypothetical protein
MLIIIPVIWEAEIGRMAIGGQSRKKNLQDPISTNKLGMIICFCGSSYEGGCG